MTMWCGRGGRQRQRREGIQKEREEERHDVDTGGGSEGLEGEEREKDGGGKRTQWEPDCSKRGREGIWNGTERAEEKENKVWIDREQ